MQTAAKQLMQQEPIKKEAAKQLMTQTAAKQLTEQEAACTIHGSLYHACRLLAARYADSCQAAHGTTCRQMIIACSQLQCGYSCAAAHVTLSCAMRATCDSIYAGAALYAIAVACIYMQLRRLQAASM